MAEFKSDEKYYWVNSSEAKFKLLWGYVIQDPITKEYLMSHYLYFSSKEDADRFAAAHVDTEFFITENLSTKLFETKSETK